MDRRAKASFSRGLALRRAAYGLLRGLLALLIGTTHALQQPDIATETLPRDVQQDLAALDPRGAFLEAGLWLVRGAS